MVPAMRRSRQALSEADCTSILAAGTSGVLALADAEGFPYSVPLSYLYSEGKIWFHCAKAGYKLDLIRSNPKASFCVIGQDKIVPAEYTTYYRSAIARGTIREITDPARQTEILRLLCRKYCPGETEASMEAEIRQYLKEVSILELDVTQLTGKQNKRLVSGT